MILFCVFLTHVHTCWHKFDFCQGAAAPGPAAFKDSGNNRQSQIKHEKSAAAFFSYFMFDFDDFFVFTYILTLLVMIIYNVYVIIDNLYLVIYNSDVRRLYFPSTVPPKYRQHTAQHTAKTLPTNSPNAATVPPTHRQNTARDSAKTTPKYHPGTSQIPLGTS